MNKEETYPPENLENLINKILNEANDKVKEIQEEASSQLEKFEKETLEEIIKIKEKELEKESSRLEFLRKRTKAEFEQEAKKMIIQAKEELIDEVFKELENHLHDLRTRKDYTEYIERKLKSVIGRIRDKDFKLKIDTQDESLFNRLIGKIEKETRINISLEPIGLQTAGGFILTDKDERISMDFTIEHLLKESKEKIRSKINEILFE